MMLPSMKPTVSNTMASVIVKCVQDVMQSEQQRLLLVVLCDLLPDPPFCCLTECMRNICWTSVCYQTGL